MADMMTFPDTVEEFMEEYKLVDTEQVYTNGTELVPIFRMKQWFEHEKAQLSKEGATKGTTSEQPTIRPVATDTNVGDKISRQEAIDRFNVIRPVDPKKDEYTKGIDVGMAMCIVAVKDQPSAQPEPHEGHWIPHESPDGGEQYECSRCGVLWEFNDGTPEDNEAYYCPKCGARMKGEAND